MDEKLLLPANTLKDFCFEYHIKQLSFFGSVLRDDFSPQSDIDILVEFDEEHIPGFDFFLIENKLSKLMGRKVDLQTIQFLSPEIRQSVVSGAFKVYEQA